jgi:hypothetical protein
MPLPNKFEGRYTDDVGVDGVVGKNTATVQVQVWPESAFDSFTVVGSSKRNKGETYNAEVGANLALADAFEQAAAYLRKTYTPKD